MIPRKPKRFLHAKAYNAQVRCPMCSHTFSVDLVTLDQLEDVFCEECLSDGMELISYGKVTRLIENPDFAIWKMWRDAFDRTKYKQ